MIYSFWCPLWKWNIWLIKGKSIHLMMINNFRLLFWIRNFGSGSHSTSDGIIRSPCRIFLAYIRIIFDCLFAGLLPFGASIWVLGMLVTLSLLQRGRVSVKLLSRFQPVLAQCSFLATLCTAWNYRVSPQFFSSTQLYYLYNSSNFSS